MIKWRRESQMHVMPAYGSDEGDAEQSEQRSPQVALRAAGANHTGTSAELVAKTEDKVDVGRLSAAYPLSSESTPLFLAEPRAEQSSFHFLSRLLKKAPRVTSSLIGTCKLKTANSNHKL